MIMYALFVCCCPSPLQYVHIKVVQFNMIYSKLPWVLSLLSLRKIYILVFIFTKRIFLPFGLMCRSRRPEAGRASAGAGELLWGWQHLRWHRGQRSQLETQHTGPQCCLRYERPPSLSGDESSVSVFDFLALSLCWKVIAKFGLNKNLFTLSLLVCGAVMLLRGLLPA